MKKKVFFRGPLLTRSGYGEQARFAMRALASRPDLFDIYIQPLEWGKTSWTNEDTPERAWIDRTIEKTLQYIQQNGQFDISFQVTIPNEWDKPAPINIGYTAGIETTKTSHQWIQKGNEMDGIIVVSNHAKNTFLATDYQLSNQQTNQTMILKLDTPIEAVNYPAKKFDTLPDVDLDLEYEHNFLVAAQMGPRKNLQNTIKWFVEEFREEEVGLVVKCYAAKNCLLDREMTMQNLRQLISSLGEKKCKVYLLHGDMTDEEMHSLQTHPKISAFLSLAHGEGFGLPIFEASYSGNPVIATGWSGQLDFLVDEEGKSNFYNVNFDLNQVQPAVVWDGVLIADSMWAYPREQSAKKCMRDCYNDIVNQTEGSVATSACTFAESVQERFSQEKQYKAMVDAVLKFSGNPEEEQWRDVLDQVVEYD